MKVSSEKNIDNSVEVFYKEEGTKSFEGIVKVYDETFYVNTATGVGFDNVLRKVEPLINKMASKTYMSGHNFEDIKQELMIIAIHGIRSYNPSKGTKLSSFLQTHLRNKLISKLRSINKMSNDSFAFLDNKEDESEGKIKKAREEVSFSSCSKDKVTDPSMMFENTIAEDEGLYGRTGPSFADVELNIALDSLLKNVDEETKEMVNLLFYEGYTIKAVSEKIGLTGTAVSSRVKKLFRTEKFKEILKDYRWEKEN